MEWNLQLHRSLWQNKMLANFLKKGRSKCFLFTFLPQIEICLFLSPSLVGTADKQRVRKLGNVTISDACSSAMTKLHKYSMPRASIIILTWQSLYDMLSSFKNLLLCGDFYLYNLAIIQSFFATVFFWEVFNFLV